MNSLSRFLLPLTLLPAVAVFASTPAQPSSATVVVGPEYSANKGLYVPEDTRRSLGLKVVDVDEQQIAATLDFSLYVYGRNGQTFLASGRVPASHAHALKTGQSISIRSAGLTATLLRVESTGKSTTIEVVAEIPAADGVALGSFLKATLIESSPEASASVPRSALVRSTEGYFVYATSGEHFVRTPVKVGALTADRAIIKDGLYAGDRVVAEPVMSLWLTELAAVKGGHACCAVPAGGK